MTLVEQVVKALTDKNFRVYARTDPAADTDAELYIHGVGFVQILKGEKDVRMRLA